MQVKDANRSRRNVGALALSCLILQLAVAPNIAVGNGRANVAYVFAALVALTIGGRTGVISGFVAGLVFDLTTTGPIGLMSLLLTTAAYLLGLEVRDRLTEDPGSSFMLAVFGALSVSFLYHFAMLLLGQAGSFVDVVILRALPTALLTVLFYLPFALIMSYRGTSNGLNGGRGRRGGHYSMGGR